MSDSLEKSLRQEKMFETRRVRLLDDHVELKVEDRTVETSLEFPYDEIGSSITYRREKSQPTYSFHVLTRNAAIVLLFCSVFGAFDGWSWFFAITLSSLVFFVIHAFARRSLLTIESDGSDELELLRETPSRVEVDQFVEELFDRRNEYVKKLYAEKALDPNTDRERWLEWMRARKVLSSAEYDRELTKLRESSEEIGY